MRTIYALAFVCALIGACAWGEGSPGDDPTPDASSSTPFCGDGVCAASEIGSCTTDCGTPAGPTCGNGVCEAGESPATCASDCQAEATCGNNICESTESASSCPGDCGGQGGTPSNCPADPIECFPCALGLGGCPAGHTEASCSSCILGP